MLNFLAGRTIHQFFHRAFFSSCLLVAASSCSQRREFWIYSSLPKESVSELTLEIEAIAAPLELKWFQASAEVLRERIRSEKAQKETSADLVLTNDHTLIESLFNTGDLLIDPVHNSPAPSEGEKPMMSGEISVSQNHPSRKWVLEPPYASYIRFSAVGFAYHSQVLKEAEVPKTWKALATQAHLRQTSLASPFDSPSAYMTLFTLSQVYGWSFLTELGRVGLVAQGNHGAALLRLASRERPVAVLPLEVVVREMSEAPYLRFIYPQDGVILVPNSVALLAGSAHADVGRRVVSWLHGEVAKRQFIRSGYSVRDSEGIVNEINPKALLPNNEGAKNGPSPSSTSSIAVKPLPPSQTTVAEGKQPNAPPLQPSPSSTPVAAKSTTPSPSPDLPPILGYKSCREVQGMLLIPAEVNPTDFWRKAEVEREQTEARFSDRTLRAL